MTNMLAGKKAGRKKLNDFLLEWDRKPQTWEEQLALVRAMNRRLGGTDTTEQGRRAADGHDQSPRDSAGPDPGRRRRAGRRARRGPGPS
ncbi:hypothetical protein AB1460_28890 [Parafrankia sp. FMc2]